jgi:DNA-directed RNA polymerase specialized sigma24 family protein
MTDSPQSGVKHSKSDASTLLERAKTGEKAALKALLARERGLLYDYLMRMTGQMQRSLDTVDEVFLAMNARALQDVEDVRQLRGILIKTVRKFSLDIWNAGTSMLENAALSAGESDPPRSGKKPVASQPTQQQIFDKAFRSLSGGERETLWLAWNLRWTEDTIAEATFRTKEEVQSLLKQGIAKIRVEAPSLAGIEAMALGRLQVPHPVELAKTGVTVELSQVMRGIQERPTGNGLKRYLLLACILLSFVALGLYKRRAIESAFRQMFGGRSHGRTYSP